MKLFKRNIYNLLSVLLLFLSLTSCDDQVFDGDASKEGYIMVRSLNNPDGFSEGGLDDMIYSLRILAFDAGSGLCKSNELYYATALTGNVLSHPILKGKYDFVFLANEPMLAEVRTRLEDIDSYNALKKMDYSAASFNSDDYIPMIAENKNVEVLSEGKINVNGSELTVLDVKLRRLAARVDVLLKSKIDLGNASSGSFKGVSFSNIPDRVPLVWGLSSDPISGSWVYEAPYLPYVGTPVDRTTTVRKLTLADNADYFDIDPSLLSTEDKNAGLVWAATVKRVIIPSSYFDQADDAVDAPVFTVNIVDKYSPSCLLKILSDPDYRLPANARLELTGIIMEPLEMNITPKAWEPVSSAWETEQLYLNLSQTEVNITDFNGARVTFESNAPVVRVSGIYDALGAFQSDAGKAFNQLQWGTWSKRWNYEYDAVAKTGKGYLDIIVNNQNQATGTYQIVLRASRKETWESANTLALSRRVKVNVTQEGTRYMFSPSSAASAYTGSAYIGAFYRNHEVGERIIQSMFWGGWWEATVPDAYKSWIKLSSTPSFDPMVGTSNPGEAEYYPVVPDYYRGETGFKVAGMHRIYFRVGLASTLPAGSMPRYGYVNLRYISGSLAGNPPAEGDTHAATSTGSEEIKTLCIYIRQGEADDYILDTSIDIPDNTSVSRDAGAICKFSPFNITVQSMLTDYNNRTDDFVKVVGRATTFVKYPSQAGALFQWGSPTEKYRKYAYYIRSLDANEFIDGGAIPNDIWGGNHKYDYDPFWIAPAGHEYSSFEEYGEVCPPGYRRPNNGVLSALAKNGTIQEVAKSEYLASLFREIPVGDSHRYIPDIYPNDPNAPNGIVRYIPKAVTNAQFGFYADGFFDRYPIQKKTLSAEEGNVEGVCLEDARAAFKGTLFFNPVTNASIFFPAAGRRQASDGKLQFNGGTGYYLTASLGNQWIDPSVNYSFKNVWQMEFTNFPAALSAVPGFGVSLRCVVDE